MEKKNSDYCKHVVISKETHKRLKDHINNRFGKGTIGSYVEDLIQKHLDNPNKQDTSIHNPPSLS